jgi:probable HAF family extracellular repeat protein
MRTNTEEESMRSVILRACLAGVVVVSATVVANPARAAPAPAAAVRTYTYVDLGVLPGVPAPPGRSSANGVNTAGDVAGTSSAPGRATGLAYLYRGDRMSSLGSIYASYGAGSFGSDLNDAGVVVGATHVNATDPPHAFVYRSGVMTDLGTGFGPGSGSFAAGISNAGHVVGRRNATQLGAYRATMWLDGRIINLPGLSQRGSEANAVNDTGQVVGLAWPASGAARAVVWTNRVAQDLGTLGGNHEAAVAHDIANTGVVVGQAPTAGRQLHAFLWRGGVMRDLGTLPGGDGFSYAYGVNRFDQAVGLATVAGGQSDHRNRAVLYENGLVVDLNTRVVNLPASVSLASANAISDTGVIVGNGCLLPCNPFQPGGTAFMLMPNP